MPSEAVKVAQERQALMDLMDTAPYKIPKRMIDENLLLATWNIQSFTNKKTERALQYIADICERFDIIALQELKTDLRGIERLRQLLPGNYRLLVTDPTGNYERMGFLYDKRTVFPTGLTAEIGFTVPASTHTGYQLHRMPFCVSFRAGRFDFIVVNVHIYCGSSSAEKKRRKEEIQKLVDFIDYRSRRDSSKVFDKDFVVVGDFNVESLGDEFFDALQSKRFIMPAQMGSLFTNFSRNKTFDKIAWVDRPSFFFTGECNVVPFSDVLFQDKSPKGGKAQISDHLPLWAEFQINELTQELDQIVKQGA